MRLKKFDDELQIVYGEVYAPDVLDAHGDFMDAVTIRKMAHRFLAKQRTQQVDTDHDNDIVEAAVVESFIARKEDPLYIEGSWVVGVHVEDKDLWQKVKDGTYNGFSIEGQGTATKMEVELDVPDLVKGMTDDSDGHRHKFSVSFDEKGRLVGGVTEESEGHTHVISKGSATDKYDGHSHRFSYIEEL